MSFTKTVKDECARNKQTDPQILVAELAAIVRLNGVLYMQSFTDPRIRFTTSNFSVARRIFFLVKEISGKEPVLSTIQSTSRQKRSLQIALEDAASTARLLRAVGMIDPGGNLTERIPSKLLWGPRRSRAFLRGAFLVTGYIAAPEKAAHMEMEVPEPEMARLLLRLLKKFDIDAKILDRKDTGVYLKDGEQIASFLRVLEAHQSLLHFEDERAMKEMRNQINRRINFETANLDKTVDASMRQLALITELQQKKGIEMLDPKLRELARLRIKHPTATLKELGEMFLPPVSKSTVNHRFRKLTQIAEEELGYES